MNKDILAVYWKKGWVSFFISAVCFLYLLNFTWLKWGDLIVDVGREMYVPLELSKGKMLYRDIFYLYGPFSAYFNAFLFKTLGTHIYSLIASGIITTMLVSILIYKISRFFLNTLFSTLAVLTFLFVFAFGQYVYLGNYNFIIPYSYPAIHGILFGLSALYFFYRSFSQKSRNACFYCVFMALVFLCRLEMGIELVLSVVLIVIVYGLSYEEPVKRIFYNLLVYAVLPFVLAITIYGLFLIKSFGALKESNLFYIGFNNMNINDKFTGWLSGASDIPGNTRIMFRSILYYLFFCLIFVLGGFILAHISRFKPLLKRISCVLLVGLFFIGGSSLLLKKIFTYDLQYRCLPLICLATILISLYRFVKAKSRKDYLFIAAISLFSLFLMMRTLFYVWAGHYGFSILVPGMIVYYIFFFKIIADFIRSDIAKMFLNLGLLSIFVLFIIWHFSISRLCYLNKTLEVSSLRGNLYVFNNIRERRCKELIEFLKSNTDEKESLAVFPEGLAINFLSGRNNPLYYYIYLPLDLAKKEVTGNIISDMEAKRVDYVALVQRDASEYGKPVFGRDYGELLWNYILENYILYKQFGPFPFTTEGYGIALFKRKA